MLAAVVCAMGALVWSASAQERAVDVGLVEQAVAPASPAEPTSPADTEAIAEAFAALPLSFELNRGQAPARADYLSKGEGYMLLLGPGGAALALQQPLKGSDPAAAVGASQALVDIALVGSNHGARVEPLEALPGRSNYYIGNDPEEWLTDIPTYARVTYHGVYPGIDLTYYGNQRTLEYDFVVAPGADPDAIRLRFSGTSELRIDAAGNLIIETDGGQIQQRRPVVYQERDGARQEVPGRFVLNGREVAFSIGSYDASRPLVIDPTLTYSTFFGGDGEDPSYGMAVDAAGNFHITGVTNSMSSPPGANNFPLFNTWGPEGSVCCGGNDTGRVFVSKINATGTALLFSTYLGGFAGYGGVHPECPSVEGCGGAPGYARGWDTGHGIAADSAGNVYVTGWAESLEFPTTADAIRGSHPGPAGCAPSGEEPCYWHQYVDHPRDAFVAKFTPTGGLTYSSLIGGRGSDGGMGIEVVDSGPGTGVYLVGLAQSPDFFADDSHSPAGGGQHYPAVASFQDTLNLNSLYTGSPPPPASCIGTTPADNSRICWRDGFAMKLSLDAKTVAWSTLIGGTADDGAYGIAVNRTTGDVVVAGETESTDFPAGAGTVPAQQPCLGGDGSYHAEPTIATAADAPFPCHMTPTPAVGEADSTNKPNPDAFVAKFTPAGVPVFMTYLGGSMDDNAGATLDDLAGDFGDSVAVDDTGNIYVTGWTESTATPIAMCGPPVNDNQPGDDPCPYKVPFPTTVGAYMEGMPQDPIAACGPGAPPDCVAPNKRLHAVAYVAKMNPNGQWGPTSPAVVPAGPAATGTYSSYLGGYGDDAAFSIAVDSAGQAYVVGVADSVNFPGTANGTIPGFPNTVPTNRYIAHPNCPNCGGNVNGILPPYDPDAPPQFSDGFVVKMNALGSGLIYSSYLGGSGDEVIHGIVHSTRAGVNGVYVAGLTTSEDPGSGGGVPAHFPPPEEGEPPWPLAWYAFPVTPDAYQPLHKLPRMVRCDGAPPSSEADDYPCPPLPAIPNEDAFITRLNDNADEFPAAPVGSAPLGPSFTVTATPNTLAINKNANATFDVTVNPDVGFTDDVTVSHSVSPASGLTVTPATVLCPAATCPAPPANTFTVTASDTASGTYTITVTGTSGAPPTQTTKTTTVTVNVPDFAIANSPASVSFAGDGGSGSFTTNVAALGDFVGDVDLTHSVDAPGLTVTPAGTTTVAAPGSATFNMTATAAGTYTVTVTGTGTVPGSGPGTGVVTRTATVTVTVRPPDFSLTPTPASITFSKDAPANSGTFSVKVNPADAFDGAVTLTHTSTPPGLTITPASPTSAPPYAPVMFTATSTTAGTYTVTVTGTGSDAYNGTSLSRTTTVTVIVADNTGFRSPTVQSAANSEGDGNGFHLNPTRAFADNPNNSSFAEDRDSGQGTGTSCTSSGKDSHRYYGYGVTLPAGAAVTGIEVRLDAWANAPAGNNPKMCVQLSSNNGSSWTTAKPTPSLTTGQQTYLLGGAADDWGRTWTSAQVGSTFQVRITNVSSLTTTDFFLDWVAVKVHYAGGAITPDFSMTATPSSATVNQGVSAAYTVNINRVGGHSAGVNLSTTGLPAGATATFNPNPATGASSALTVATSLLTPPGTYPFTITGVAGALTRTTTATLVVQAFTPPDYTLSLTPTTGTVAQGDSESYVVGINRVGGFTGAVNFTISGLPAGASGTFNPNPASGDSSTLQVNTSLPPTTPTGTYNFTVTGTSGLISRTVNGTLVVVAGPPYTLSMTPSSVTVTQGTAAAYTVNITRNGGFAGAVQFTTSGLPAGAGATFTPNPSSGNSSALSVATTGVTPGTYPFTVTGTSGTLTQTADATLVVEPAAAPTFTISANPTSRSVNAGSSTTYAITVNRAGGYTGPVAFTVTGQGAGTTATFNPASTTGNTTTLNISTTTSAAQGPFDLIITATGGSTTRTLGVTLTVNPSQGCQGEC